MYGFIPSFPTKGYPAKEHGLPSHHLIIWSFAPGHAESTLDDVVEKLPAALNVAW